MREKRLLNNGKLLFPVNEHLSLSCRVGVDCDYPKWGAEYE
jgi:hypothetical protein